MLNPNSEAISSFTVPIEVRWIKVRKKQEAIIPQELQAIFEAEIFEDVIITSFYNY